MTNNTALANAALAMLGELAISSIDDTTSKPARVCKQFVGAALTETLQLGRWNRATARASLLLLSEVPASGFTHYFQLPGDCLRVMEINGEQFEDSSEYYEIEGTRIASDEDELTIRFISATHIADLGPLLQNAIVCRLASKIALPLTSNGNNAQLMDAMFRKALGEARQIDAQESGSRENAPWARILGRSRLIRSKARTRNPERLEDS